jgi:hypothetical protein
VSEIWRFSGETARAFDIAMTGRCGCPGQGSDNPEAHANACPRRAVLATSRAAREAAEALARPGRVIINTAPQPPWQVPPSVIPAVMPCGCRSGCTGHALPPVLGLTAAELLITPPQGPACGCTAPPSAPPWAHGITCPVLMQWAAASGVIPEGHGGYCGCRGCVAARTPAARESSGRPDKAGIPLWDEDKHAALAEMSGPLTLPEKDLPAYDAVPPGCCTGCHLPVPAGTAVCFYCNLAQALNAARAGKRAELASPVADELARRAKTCGHRHVRDGRCTRCGQFTPVSCGGNHLRPSDRRRCRTCSPVPPAGRYFGFLAVALVLFILGVHVWFPLAVPAVLLAALGTAGIKRRLR